MPDSREVPMCPFTLSLPPGATVHVSTGGSMTVAVGRRQYDLGRASPGLDNALHRLAGAAVTEEELRDGVVALDGADALPGLYLCLLALSSRGLLCHGVVDGGKPLLTALPTCRQYHLGPTRTTPISRYVLSRFALFRRSGDQLVVESPRAFSQVAVHDPRVAALLAALSTPRRFADLDPVSLGISQESMCLCVDLLERLLFLRSVDASAGYDEDTDAALASWEFHDLLLHSRSRRGRHRNPYGAAYPLRDRMAPLPAIKGRPDGVVVPLVRPDLDLIQTSDRPFTTVLEERRSRRRHGDVPITDRQLGEFLYRACRVRRVIPPGIIHLYEATDRVYPSGGAAYPLELYVIVNRCSGLTSGLYHYRPTDHDLTRLSEPTAATKALLEAAAFTVGGFSPQVLFVFAARVQRVTWKYSSMAYATILKDLGVLYQTMYLVATAMGLAACALGGGNADVFAEATGLDYYAEPSVGEFILGTVTSDSE